MPCLHKTFWSKASCLPNDSLSHPASETVHKSDNLLLYQFFPNNTLSETDYPAAVGKPWHSQALPTPYPLQILLYHHTKTPVYEYRR